MEDRPGRGAHGAPSVGCCRPCQGAVPAAALWPPPSVSRRGEWVLGHGGAGLLRAGVGAAWLGFGIVEIGWGRVVRVGASGNWRSSHE